MRTIFFRNCLFLSFFLGLTPCLAATNDDIKSLIQEKKYEEAFALGQSAFVERAGEPEFDFLLGLAALESGHSPEAVFAFERVLNADPSNNRARFELGRALYNTQSFAEAKASFEIVLANSPKPDIKDCANTYLDIISQTQPLQKPVQFALQATTSGGYSTNINTGPNFNLTLIPVGNLNRPQEVPLELSDGFFNGELAGEVRFRLTDRGLIRTRLTGGYRKNLSGRDFDYQTLALESGVDWQLSDWHLSIPLGVRTWIVNYGFFQWTFMGGAQIGLDINKQNRLSLGGTADFSYYPRDLGQGVYNLKLSLGWEFVRPNLEVAVNLYGALGLPKHEEQAFQIKDFFGGEASARYEMMRHHDLILSLTTEHSIYRAINPQYSARRNDWLVNAMVAWRWSFLNSLSIQPSYGILKTFSNIVEYEHVRHEVQLGLFWDLTL